MIGAAIAVPVGAVIQAGQRAGVRNILCIVITPWVARACCARQHALPHAVDRRGPDVVAGGDRRGAARHTARPAARKPAVRSSARTPQARPPSANPAPSASLTAGITPSVARALLYQAPTGQTETTIDRSQFDNRPALLGGRRAAREPRHLGEAGQRAARYRHLDPRFQRPQRFWHPQPRDLRRRLSGHAAGRAFPQRPDRSPGLWRDRRHPGTVVGALWQLCHRRRAQFPHPSGPAPSTASNTASKAAALATSTTILPPARRSAISSTRCLRAMRGATGSSRIAGSTPRR